MGRSHHDQVRPVLSAAAIASPRLAIGSDRPVFPGNGQTLRDAFDPKQPWLLIGLAFAPALAAEREQVRMVINLISGVKMPFPENRRKITDEGINVEILPVVKGGVDRHGVETPSHRCVMARAITTCLPVGNGNARCRWWGRLGHAPSYGLD